MGIGAIYKQLYFDSESSGSYGLYITGAGVFNAPERDAEFVTIPGRNGAYLLDHGRFENIEITYPAGCFGTDSEDFATTIANIRAWLCSKRGYVRLIDDYNPDEYRLAVYKSGLDVSPAMLKAGQFDLVFECMPQRFLTSGTTKKTIASSGDTISNPTKFPSRPMLEVTGYGKIGINGEEIEVISEAIGTVICMTDRNVHKVGLRNGINFIFNPSYSSLNTGDQVYIRDGEFIISFLSSGSWEPRSISNFSETGGLIGSPFISGSKVIRIPFVALPNPFTFNLGTSASATATFDVTAELGNTGTTETFSVVCGLTVNTDGDLIFAIEANNVVNATLSDRAELKVGYVIGDSTKSALGSPIYIDLDIGEAWKYENSEMVSVNSAVSMPAELPELHPGSNTITFDNTVTNLKILPRWWTV